MAVRATPFATDVARPSERARALPRLDVLGSHSLEVRAGFALPTKNSRLPAGEAAAFEQRAGQSLRDVVARGFDGPRTTRALAKTFLAQTLVHSHDVATVARALGVDAPRHDLLELRPVEDLKRLKSAMDAGHVPGIPIGATPAWVSRMIFNAERSATRQVDVGKLNPYVTAGLAITQKPEEPGADYVAARAIHRLADHHVHRGPEMAADIINSIRMPRIYRPHAMSFAATRAIARAKAELDGWSPDQLALLDLAVGLQEKLENTGAITSYLSSPQSSSGDGWNAASRRGRAR